MEWDGPSRWAVYLGTYDSSSLSSTSSMNFGHDGQSQGSTPSKDNKGCNMQWLVQLTDVTEGLMDKMYMLNQLLDYPDSISYLFLDGFWKAWVFPNHPRICVLLSKKFPKHFS